MQQASACGLNRETEIRDKVCQHEGSQSVVRHSTADDAPLTKGVLGPKMSREKHIPITAATELGRCFVVISSLYKDAYILDSMSCRATCTIARADDARFLMAPI